MATTITPPSEEQMRELAELSESVAPELAGIEPASFQEADELLAEITGEHEAHLAGYEDFCEASAA